jgi:hypothetical protein
MMLPENRIPLFRVMLRALALRQVWRVYIIFTVPFFSRERPTFG